LHEPDLIVKIVENLAKNLKVPVTCKIRKLPSDEETLKLAKRIEEAGCSILTVHGRTKEQNKQTVGVCDWDIIRKVKESAKIPIFANGGIHTHEDIRKCLEYTGVDGVMSAESLLENGALFSGKIVDLDELAMEYLELCKVYETDSGCIRAHLFKILHTGLQVHCDLRERMVKVHGLEEFFEIVRELRKRRAGVGKEEKFGWYERHMRGEVVQEEEGKGEKGVKVEVQAASGVEMAKVEEDFDSMNSMFSLEP